MASGERGDDGQALYSAEPLHLAATDFPETDDCWRGNTLDFNTCGIWGFQVAWSAVGRSADAARATAFQSITRIDTQTTQDSIVSQSRGNVPTEAQTASPMALTFWCFGCIGGLAFR